MFVMVLNDGETYTDLAGCKILQIDDSVEVDDVDVAIRHMDPKLVAVIAQFDDLAQ